MFVPQICRDGIANFKFYHIARNDFICGDCGSLAVAGHYSCGRTQGAEGVHRLLGSEVLVNANDYVKNNDRCNKSTFDPGLDAEADCHGNDEDL